MNLEITQKNIAPDVAAGLAKPRPRPVSPTDPMAGYATPAGIASAVAAARGSTPDTALLLAAFGRLASVQGDKDLHLLCINLETVLKGGL